MAPLLSDPLLDLLHLEPIEVEPLLPLGDSLLDILRATWPRPSSSDPVDRAVARQHRPAPGDPPCLSLHQTAQGPVVQASFNLQSSPALPLLPPARESRWLDDCGRRLFASASASVRALNTACVFARASSALWDSVAALLPSLPETRRPELLRFLLQGRGMAQLFTVLL